MTYIDLLGRALKDPVVIDVLEADDLEVIYDFDRLSENQPDQYWVASTAEGVQMRFNADQVLDVLFFYLEPDGNFAACNPKTMGIPVFSSLDEATHHAEVSNLPFEKGEVDFLGVYREWIKIDRGAYLHHSEFRGAHLHQITASLR